MVLLDLLHIQRAGFFTFLKSGISKELSQLNINIENTRLQVVPFNSLTEQPDLKTNYRNIKGSAYPLPFVPLHLLHLRCTTLTVGGERSRCITKGEVPLRLNTLTVGGERSRCTTFGNGQKNSAEEGVKKLQKLPHSVKNINKQNKIDYSSFQYDDNLSFFNSFSETLNKISPNNQFAISTADKRNKLPAIYHRNNGASSCFTSCPKEGQDKRGTQKRVVGTCIKDAQPSLPQRGTKSQDAIPSIMSPEYSLGRKGKENEKGMTDSEYEEKYKVQKVLNKLTTGTPRVGCYRWDKPIQAKKVAKTVYSQRKVQVKQKLRSYIAYTKIALSDLQTKPIGTRKQGAFMNTNKYALSTFSLPLSPSQVFPEHSQGRKSTTFFTPKGLSPSAKEMQSKGSKYCIEDAQLVLSSTAKEPNKRQKAPVHNIQRLTQNPIPSYLSALRIYEPLLKTKYGIIVKQKTELNSTFSSVNGSECFRLIAPKYTPKEAILNQKSWSCKIVVKVLFTLGYSSKNLLTPSTTKSSPPLPQQNTYLPTYGSHPLGESEAMKMTGTQKKVVIAYPQPFVPTTFGEKCFTPLGYISSPSLSPSLPQRGTKEQCSGTKGQDALPKEKEVKHKKGKLSSVKMHKIQHHKTENDEKALRFSQELFLVLGELPLMTKRGHFIIHGSPRVILSQLIRTPGIYFSEKDKNFQADCVPEQGPWLCIYKNISSSLQSEALHVPQGDTLALSKNDEITPFASFPRDNPSPLVSTHSKYNKTIAKTSVSHLYQPESVDSQKQDKETAEPFSHNKNRSIEYKTSTENSWKNINFSSYFCYTKQFSSLPFSLVYSNFKTFELHSQFTNQTLLLTKLKALEKIRYLRETITTLLAFTWKKRIRKKLQKLYTKKCFTATQQFEKTKLLLRLKKKLILGSLGRKKLNEKLGISNCIDIWTTQDVYKMSCGLATTLPYRKEEPFAGARAQVGRNLVKKQKTSFQTTHSPNNYHHEDKLVKITGANKNLMKESIHSVESLEKIHENKENTKRKQGMWLYSNTLLSQDLAKIVSLLDGSKTLSADDIDDLNNQRVITSSAQIQQQLRMGCFRFRKMFIKLARESWGVSQTITDFLNGALREFFGSNPLSQFLDQTNPLAEITHKRRISKLGMGGIQRESATLKVRTIHSTYFGRICPIETPEGINAGLVNSLTCLSRVNLQGQLVTPLSPLLQKQMQNKFYFYSNQEQEPISTMDTALLKFQRLPNQFIGTKKEAQFEQLLPNAISVRVQSDLQTISLATALIPFLAYDDANRALMGSNMQRQAVPLIIPERPMIRTGLEALVIGESGHSFQAPNAGFISYVSAQFILITNGSLNKLIKNV